MSTTHARPKDLRAMLDDARTDDASAGGTNDPVVLRSRIEQQSDLIMLLKRHNDAMNLENKTMTSQLQREKQGCRAASADKQKAVAAYDQLERRFRTLSSQHDELIVIKDEHKAEKKRLQETVRGFEVELLVAKERWKAESETALAALEAQVTALEQTGKQQTAVLKQAEIEIATTKAAAVAANREAAASLKASKIQAAGLEEQIDNLKAQLADATSKAKQAATQAAEQAGKLTTRLAAAEKEVEAVKAGREAKHKELTLVLANLAAMESQLAKGKEEWAATPELEDVNGQLAKLQREYAAYKKYSKQLLDNEKEVNARLRTLNDS